MRASFGLAILKPELCGKFGGNEAWVSNFEKRFISTSKGITSTNRTNTILSNYHWHDSKLFTARSYFIIIITTKALAVHTVVTKPLISILFSLRPWHHLQTTPEHSLIISEHYHPFVSNLLEKTNILTKKCQSTFVSENVWNCFELLFFLSNVEQEKFNQTFFRSSLVYFHLPLSTLLPFKRGPTFDFFIKETNFNCQSLKRGRFLRFNRWLSQKFRSKMQNSIILSCLYNVYKIVIWDQMFVIRKACVNFINILHKNFLYKSALRSFSLVTFWLCNFLAQKYWYKICS